MFDLLVHFTIFFVLAFWVGLEPGPGFLKLTQNHYQHGTSAAAIFALGMFLGAIPIIIMTAFGLGMILQNSHTLATGLKFIGAAYLIWLAMGMFREAKATQDSEKSSSGTSGSTSGVLFQGALLVITNPRTYLFYPAFLPLFIIETGLIGLSSQLLFLGISVAAVFLIVDLCFIATLNKLGGSLVLSNQFSKLARVLGASTLVILGFRMLVSSED